MGSVSPTCMNKSTTTPATTPVQHENIDQPTPDEAENMKSSLSDQIVKSVEFLNWMEPWLGEWTYIIKNQVHSFDITSKDGELMYEENMGRVMVKGGVVVDKKRNNRARIIAKSMNFEIDLDRVAGVARYRKIGASKWSKKINLEKVHTIPDTTDDESLSLWQHNKNGTQGSEKVARDTLRNTWRNQDSVRGLCRDLQEDIARSKTLPRLGSMRRRSIRKMNTAKHYNENQEQSFDQQGIDELFRRNSSRKSIRFAEEDKIALLADTMNEENNSSDTQV